MTPHPSKPNESIGAREFWIVRHFSKSGEINLIAADVKPEWASIQLGDERIHVIEYQALTTAQARIRELEQANAEIVAAFKSADIEIMNCQTMDQVYKSTIHLRETLSQHKKGEGV
jgi:hypothetical protein